MKKSFGLDSTKFAKLGSGSIGTGYARTREQEILNPYVNFSRAGNEQDLYDSLVQEAIQMRGRQMYFVPRQYVNIDEVFGEDVKSYFSKSWAFATVINNYDAFEGVGAFFSKFGYQSNDEMELAYNPNLFAHQTEGQQPRAGDLIYAPLINSLFEITYVQADNPYGSLGSDRMYRKMTCVKWTPSHEEIDIDLQIPENINIPEFSDDDLFSIDELQNMPTSRDDGDFYADSDESNETIEPIRDDFIMVSGESKPIKEDEMVPLPEPHKDDPLDPFAFEDY